MLISIVGLAPTGCSLRIGPDVDTMEVNPNKNAEKNLDAVRAMQADRYRRVPVAGAWASPSTLSPNGSLESARSSEAPVLLNTAPPVAPDQAKADTPGNSSQVRSFVVPPSPTERYVPAYTIAAAVGPNQTGLIRCVPDGSGGQRCLARQP